MNNLIVPLFHIRMGTVSVTMSSHWRMMDVDSLFGLTPAANLMHILAGNQVKTILFI